MSDEPKRPKGTLVEFPDGTQAKAKVVDTPDEVIIRLTDAGEEGIQMQTQFNPQPEDENDLRPVHRVAMQMIDQFRSSIKPIDSGAS